MKHGFGPRRLRRPQGTLKGALRAARRAHWAGFPEPNARLVVEYQNLTGTQAASENEQLPGDVGGDPSQARSVTEFSGDDEDSYFVRQFVYSRAPSADVCRRVLEHLERVLDLGTYIEVGTSQISKDDYNNYLMIRDEGK